VTAARTTIKATEIRLGDRVRTHAGDELTVTRIDESFLGRPDFLAFVEDSDEQWMKMPAGRDAEVELVRPAAG
jgi:hypothetical protein